VPIFSKEILTIIYVFKNRNAWILYKDTKFLAIQKGRKHKHVLLIDQ